MIGGFLDERRPPASRVVAAIGLLDLDHVRAHVGHDRARQRTRERLPDFNDFDSGKRTLHCAASS
jgi:hypothetical protein